MASEPECYNVLVIDDDETMRELVVAFLRKAGMQTHVAFDGAAGLRLAHARADIDAIVLDVMMPGMDGYSVLAQLKGDEATRAIPVVLLTAHANDERDVLRGIEGGAVDHLSKPFRGRILAAKVLSMCQRYREQSGMRDRVASAETMAQTDALTGLCNRRAFDDALARATATCLEGQQPLSLVMVDVDHFKAVNDDYGHEAGDAVLRWLAGLLARTSVRAYRLGGEEFCLILEGVDPDGARAIADSLLAAVREGGCPVAEGESLAVTVSAGIACAGEHNAFAVDDIVARADAALYDAKNAGRDRWALESD